MVAMKKMEPDEYRALIEWNIRELDGLLSGDEELSYIWEYPVLFKRLTARGRYSIGYKLKHILEYLSEYGKKDQRQILSYSQYRGYEMALSQDMMVNMWGGGKPTWWNAVNVLCTLGLLERHIPDRDSDNSNTPAQAYSVKRAKKATKRRNAEIAAEQAAITAANTDILFDDNGEYDAQPVLSKLYSLSKLSKKQYRACTWYRVKKYDDGLLAEAERRAKAIETIPNSGLNKDAVRDALGDKIANHAFGTGFSMGRETRKQREQLEWTLRVQLSYMGYTYPDSLLKEAAAKGGFTRWQLEHAYKAYRATLFKRLNVEYRMPTTEERERWRLRSKRYIIAPAAPRQQQ